MLILGIGPIKRRVLPLLYAPEIKKLPRSGLFEASCSGKGPKNGLFRRNSVSLYGKRAYKKTFFPCFIGTSGRNGVLGAAPLGEGGDGWFDRLANLVLRKAC